MNAPNLNLSLNLSRIGTGLKKLSPYFLLELLLPGGSVFALLLWMRRRRKNRTVTNETVADTKLEREGRIPSICFRH